MRRQLATGLAASFLWLCAAAAQAGWEEGVMAFQSGNYTAAAQEFQVVVDQQPSWPGGYLMMGRTLLKLNRQGDAVGYLQQAYELNPADSATSLTLGRTLLDLDRPADALAVLGKTPEADIPAANRPTFYQLRGQAYLQNNQPQSALPDLAQAARLSPDSAALQLLYGTQELKYGELERALPALAAALRLAPDNLDANKANLQGLLELARHSEGAEQTAAYGRVADAAAQLVKLDSTFDNLQLLASAEHSAGRLDAAFEHYGRAAELQPGEWQPYSSRAQIRLGQERYADAEPELLKAVEHAPAENQTRLWSQLGLVYEKLPAPDYFDQAKDAYRQAGDSAGLARVAENERIYWENRKLDDAQALEARKRACAKEITRILDSGGIPPSMDECLAAKG